MPTVVKGLANVSLCYMFPLVAALKKQKLKVKPSRGNSNLGLLVLRRIIYYWASDSVGWCGIYDTDLWRATIVFL